MPALEDIKPSDESKEEEKIEALKPDLPTPDTSNMEAASEGSALSTDDDSITVTSTDVEFHDYLFSVVNTIVENVLSAKMWFWLIPTILSTIFVYQKIMTSHEWAELQAVLVPTVIVVRETFKVSKIRFLSMVGDADSIAKMKV